QRKGHWLLDDYVKPVLQGQFSRFEVDEIWSYDGHEIHTFALRELALLLDHLLEGKVYPVFGNKKCFPRFARDIGVDAKSTAHQFYQAIHVCGNTVHCTDESIFPPSYHAHAKFSVHLFFSALKSSIA